MKTSRLLILAATLLRGLAALGAEAEKSGMVGAAYNSYFLVKTRTPYKFALCNTQGEILTHEEYNYLECIGKDIGKGTGLWWAMTNSSGSLTQILRDDGTPYVKERFLSSASFFRNEKGVAVLDSGEMLVPGLGESGQYFFTHIVYPDGFVQKLGKGASPTSGTRPYTTIQNSNGKVSLYDIPARKAVPGFEFDEIRLNHGHVCIVSENGKWGVADMRGNLLVPIEYDYADWYYDCWMHQDVAYVKSDGKWGLFAAERGWLVKPEDGFTAHGVSRQAVAVSKNGKYELRPLGEGRPLLAADKPIRRLYDGVDLDFWGISADNSPTVEYSSVVGISRGKVVKRIKNVTGVSPRYANGDFSKILFFVVETRDHASGALSSDGRRFLYPITKDVLIWNCWNWGNHVCIFNLQTRLHYVQTLDGKVLLDWKDGVTDLGRLLDASGYARIVRDGKAGLVDGDCRFVLPCDYEDVGHSGEGLIPAKQDGKWGFVTLDGKWPIPAGFDGARSFKRGCAPVRKDGKWGFIDKAGKAVTPFAYDDVKDVRDGHFRAKVGEKWGLFAIDGTCKLPAEYDDMLADGEYGYGDY